MSHVVYYHGKYVFSLIKVAAMKALARKCATPATKMPVNVFIPRNSNWYAI